METRQIESSDRSQRSTTTTTTTLPHHTNAILNPLSISQPSLLPGSTSSTSTSERSSYFIILFATSLWVWISQNRLAVLGAGVTFAGFVIGLAALVPAFAGQDMSQEALELARWTAMKDFIEQCWERKANGPVSDDCENAMAASLPPPPHMDFDKKMDKLVGRMSGSAFPELRFEHPNVAERHSLGMIHVSACLGAYVVLLLAWLHVQEIFRRLRPHSWLSVERRPYISEDGMVVDEEIGELFYDYVQLRPKTIRPSTIANRSQSRATEEMAHTSLLEVPGSDEPSHIAKTEGNVAINPEASVTVGSGKGNLGSGSRASRSHSDEDSDEEAALRTRRTREHPSLILDREGSLDDIAGTFSSEFARESPPWPKSEIEALDQRKKRLLEFIPRALERARAVTEAGEKRRLSARFETKADDAASMRRRQNAAAQRNRRASIVSDKSTGSVARVRRDEYATSSSNAFGALEGLEELSDEDVPEITRSSDRGTGLWGEGYVNHPM